MPALDHMQNLQQKMMSLSTIRDIVETNTAILYPHVLVTIHMRGIFIDNKYHHIQVDVFKIHKNLTKLNLKHLYSTRLEGFI